MPNKIYPYNYSNNPFGVLGTGANLIMDYNTNPNDNSGLKYFNPLRRGIEQLGNIPITYNSLMGEVEMPENVGINTLDTNVTADSTTDNTSSNTDNTQTLSADSIVNSIPYIGTATSIFDAVNDIIYNNETPLGNTKMQDEALRGTAQDRHFGNQLVELFTHPFNIGKTKHDKYMENAVKEASTLGTDVSNVRNIDVMKNVLNENTLPNTININDNYNLGQKYDARFLNSKLLQRRNDLIAGRNYALDNIATGNVRNAYLTGHIGAEGGSLEGLNGVTSFNTGNSHEQNPYGGIQQGIAQDGLPNLVEEGEKKYKDYIYSARLKPSKSLLKAYNLPEKYAGLTYAELCDKLQKESEDRPNDPISLKTLDEWMSRLQGAQEEQKAKIAERKLAKALDNMSDEQKAAIMSSLDQQVSQEGMNLGQPMYAQGGGIHIAPSKRGTFTAAAKKHGKSVQAFALQVLANKENYSPAMVKKANFARNAAKWHSDGGHLFDFGGWKNQDELNKYYQEQYKAFWNNLKNKKGSNVNKAYLTGAQARQWVNQLSEGDDQQKALANMLKNQWGDANTDWSDNATWEFKNNFLNGTVTESNPYIKWAGNNKAMKDAMWGIQHIPQLSVDNTYLYKGEPKEVTRWWKMNSDGTRTLVDNPVIEGWKYNPELDEFGPEDDGNYYLDYFLTPIETTTESKNDNTSKQKSPVTDLNGLAALRYAPILGSGLGAAVAATQPIDYTLANDLGYLSRYFKPVAAPHIGGYRRYTPYDVNLGDVENLAMEARTLDANRGQNRATQGVLNAAAINAYNKANALRNLEWQKANEANRLATDQYNLGIDQINLGVAQNYDQLNNNINTQKVNMLASAAQAADASRTAWANNISNTTTNFYNQLGNLGRDYWNRGQRDALFDELQLEGMKELFRNYDALRLLGYVG